jgi:DNA-binding NtrC family response regulator
MNQCVRVLHVDDDPDLTDLTATFLERHGEDFVIDTAASAREGLDTLADHTYDCIVSDYDMPGRNGIKFLEVVREEYPDFPFILYTGKGSEEVASDAISAGVSDYLQKKSNTEQYELLANRIQNAVEADRSRRALSEQTRRLETLINNLPRLIYRCRNQPGWPMEDARGEVEELTGYAAEALESGDVGGRYPSGRPGSSG